MMTFGTEYRQFSPTDGNENGPVTARGRPVTRYGGRSVRPSTQKMSPRFPQHGNRGRVRLVRDDRCFGPGTIVGTTGPNECIGRLNGTVVEKVGRE